MKCAVLDHVENCKNTLLKTPFSIRFVTVLNKTFSKIISIIRVKLFYLSTNFRCLVDVGLSIVVSWCDC